MKRIGLRSALLATSSALALVIGGGQAAEAQCAFNNSAGGADNAGTINCISYNNGLVSIGNVTNEATGVITATHPYPPVNAGTSTGISVVVAGTKLIGNIVNNGSISAPQYGINIGAGSHGVPPTQVGIGATLVGSITNNGTITTGGANGIVVRQSVVTGSLTNGASGIINSFDVGMLVTGVSGNLATIGGSITNNGTITTHDNDGMFVQFANVGGPITNTGTIQTGNAFAAMEVSASTVAGSFTNSGNLQAHIIGMFVDAATINGSLSNNGGTINALIGIGVQGGSGATPAIITGDVANSGTINASANTGIAVIGFNGGATIGGSVVNSGTINAPGPSGNGIALFGGVVNGGVTNSGTINAKLAGILIAATTSAAGASTVHGAVTNQGTIVAQTGIAVAGGAKVLGGITNTGNITGSRAAIDLTLFGGEGAATTITQAGGTITGNILLSALGDTVNVTGGAISGNIVGQAATGTVNFALGAGNSFVYSNSISGVKTVNVSSGTLFDNSSIGATTVNVNGGTLAPGLPNQVGTLTINGNLAFTSAGTFLVNVTPAAASFTTVSGTASLAGTVQAVFQPGNFTGRSFDILHAASLNGTTFNAVTSSNPNFGVSLSYTATDVFLNLTGQLGFGQGLPLSQNQQNVANAINAFFNRGGALPPAFANLFNLTDGNLSTALSLLTGEAATGAQQGAFQLMKEFFGLMLDPLVDGSPATGGAIGFAPTRAAIPEDVGLAYASALKAPARFEQRWTVWGSAYGGYNRTNGDPVVGSTDLTARTGGVAAGADYRIAPGTFVGFAVAGGNTNWGLAQGFGGGRSDALQAGIYGTTHAGPAYLAASLAFADHWMSTDRFAPFGDHLTASFNAQTYGGRLEGGYRFALPFAAITPYAAVQVLGFHTPSYAETGTIPGGFALGFNARDASDTRSELGTRFDREFLLNTGAVLSLRGRLAWAHDWVSDPSLNALFQSLPGAGFIVNGATPAKDSALASSLAELRLANGVSLLGKLEGEFANRSSTYAGTATVRVTW
jgi:outer membrane autotransporter protein